MKLCAAQTRPARGDIAANLAVHEKMTTLAAALKADMIIFPELSLTGYEPTLAADLSTSIDDERLDTLQKQSNGYEITIGAGIPIKHRGGVAIGMIIFQPNTMRRVYLKQFLHDDELPFFVEGNEQFLLTVGSHKLGFSICYELSVPQHSENLAASGTNIYLSSVAKSPEGVERAVNTLRNIGSRHKMIGLMANCVGYCDNFDCGGKSSAWDAKGSLLGQLDDRSEGIIVLDTESHDVIMKTL